MAGAAKEDASICSFFPGYRRKLALRDNVSQFNETQRSRIIECQPQHSSARQIQGFRSLRFPKNGMCLREIREVDQRVGKSQLPPARP
jgi:hypothetical protein